MEYMNSPDRPKPPPILHSHAAHPKLTAPARAATALLETRTPKKSHLHSLHHHHHHHHKNHNHHVRDAVQSAVQLYHPSPFGDTTKQPKHGSSDTAPSSVPSVSGSRRGSLGILGKSVEHRGTVQIPRIVRPEDVEVERQRNEKREEELRASLQTLSEHSLRATRQLDDTYYSILEKASVLQSTIDRLQQLSTRMKELHSEFESETDKLGADIQAQIDGFGDFSHQKERVQELENRVKAGRERTGALTARLGDASKRIDARKELEAEWQAAARRRMKMFWSIVGAVIVLITLTVLVYSARTSSSQGSTLGVPRPKHTLDLERVSIPSPVKELLSSIRTPSSSSPTQLPVFTGLSAEDDPRLRIFDEL